MAKLLQNDNFVVPAKAGTSALLVRTARRWVPAFADDEMMRRERSRPHLEFFSAVIPAKAGIHFDSALFAIARRSENGFRLSPE
jgi:hypothetical protein